MENNMLEFNQLDKDIINLSKTIPSYSNFNLHPAGYYIISKDLTIIFSIVKIKKPNWFHRKMTKLLLDWEWEDYKNE